MHVDDLFPNREHALSVEISASVLITTMMALS